MGHLPSTLAQHVVLNRTAQQSLQQTRPIALKIAQEEDICLKRQECRMVCRTVLEERILSIQHLMKNLGYVNPDRCCKKKH